MVCCRINDLRPLIFRTFAPKKGNTEFLEEIVLNVSLNLFYKETEKLSMISLVEEHIFKYYF